LEKQALFFFYILYITARAWLATSHRGQVVGTSLARARLVRRLSLVYLLSRCRVCAFQRRGLCFLGGGGGQYIQKKGGGGQKWTVTEGTRADIICDLIL
jgi:hypothetical protein